MSELYTADTIIYDTKRVLLRVADKRGEKDAPVDVIKEFAKLHKFLKEAKNGNDNITIRQCIDIGPEWIEKTVREKGSKNAGKYASYFARPFISNSHRFEGSIMPAIHENIISKYKAIAIAQPVIVAPMNKKDTRPKLEGHQELKADPESHIQVQIALAIVSDTPERRHQFVFGCRKEFSAEHFRHNPTPEEKLTHNWNDEARNAFVINLSKNGSRTGLHRQRVIYHDGKLNERLRQPITNLTSREFKSEVKRLVASQWGKSSAKKYCTDKRSVRHYACTRAALMMESMDINTKRDLYNVTIPIIYDHTTSTHFKSYVDTSTELDYDLLKAKLPLNGDYAAADAAEDDAAADDMEAATEDDSTDEDEDATAATEAEPTITTITTTPEITTTEPTIPEITPEITTTEPTTPETTRTATHPPFTVVWENGMYVIETDAPVLCKKRKVQEM